MVASASEKVYNLRLIGDNEALNKQFLSTADDGTLYPAGTPSGAALYTLARSASSTTIHSSTTTSNYLILQGPSGKGESMLQESSTTEPFGIGSSILHDKWLVVEEGGRSLLKYSKCDDEADYYWVASKSDGERWTVWWYSPYPWNEEDLVPYVKVDVELVEVKPQEKGEL